MSEGMKCKNCGSALHLNNAQNGVIECEYCGSFFTVPKTETNAEALSFLRQGEHDLDTCKFDDAYTAYQKAAEYDASEPEAHWGMALAEFRVQYLKDEATEPLLLQPICHEISDKKFKESKNYKKALDLATAEQRTEYIKKAGEIDDIRVEFNRLKQEGLDYDCFICVKVSDENGGTTQDSHEALRLYNHLKSRGFSPFYSEEEIKGRTGSGYEAHILYALYTSECMLLVCFDENYLQTKWVKNEYTRFLKMVAREEKERDAITFVYRGTPVERLPGQTKKLQGIDLSKPDAYSRIEEYIGSFTPISLGDAPEITRKEYGKSGYKKKTVVRKGVEKRQLASVAGGEIKVSDRAKLKIVQDFMQRGDFGNALNFCDNILRENPGNGEAYWLHFLAEQKLADEDALPSASAPIESYENFEKAIAATSDDARRKKMYAMLFERVRDLKQIKDYNEYIILPDSSDEDIKTLTTALYQDNIARLQKSGLYTETAEQVFDELIKTVTDTDTYIAMNLQFAQAMLPRSTEYAVKYYENILEVDEGQGEALYWQFVSGYGSEQNAYEHFGQGASSESEEKLFAYGYNDYAAQKLYELCVQNAGTDAAKSGKVLDFVLSMTPQKQQNRFIAFLRGYINALFQCKQFKYIERYNDMLLAADKLDDEAYFNKVLLKNKASNPLALAFVSEGLIADPDYFSAINGFAEKHPDAKANLYLDINAALQELSGYFNEESLAFAAQTLDIPKEELSSCKSKIIDALNAKVGDLVHAICKEYKVAKLDGLFSLREDITGDPRLKAALAYAEGAQNKKQHAQIDAVLSGQRQASQKNRAQDAADEQKRRKEELQGKVIMGVSIGAAVIGLLTGVFLILALFQKGTWKFWYVLFDANWNLLLLVGILIIIPALFICASMVVVSFLAIRDMTTNITKLRIISASIIMLIACTCGLVGGVKYDIAKNEQSKIYIGDTYILKVEEEYGWITIGECIGGRKTVSLPGMYNGKPINRIGYGAFEGCSKITSIEIPNSVTRIDSYAFGSCTGLKSVFIPKSVTIVENEAFSDCYRVMIYCEAESKPSDWAWHWNPNNRPVVWGWGDNGE